MFLQRQGRGRDDPGADEEDGAEAEHEQQRPEDHPTAAAVSERLVGQPGHVPEEAGNERQNARGRERDDASERGDAECHQDRGGRQVGGRHPARTSSTSPSSVAAVTGPSTRAAIRCWRSRTKVVGVAAALPLSDRIRCPPS